MIVSKNYTDKSVVILGLGRSGIALAEALSQSGAKVLVWDDNPDVLGVKVDVVIPVDVPPIVEGTVFSYHSYTALPTPVPITGVISRDEAIVPPSQIVSVDKGWISISGSGIITNVI